MTKHINIYLTDTEHEILDDLKYKYRVSLSTICNILVLEYSLCEQTAELIKQNLKQKGQKKTHIKVQSWNEEVDTNKIYSNAIHIYCNKLDRAVMNDKQYQAKRNRIHTKLQKSKDRYWNYNEYRRMHSRIENSK